VQAASASRQVEVAEVGVVAGHGCRAAQAGLNLKGLLVALFGLRQVAAQVAHEAEVRVLRSDPLLVAEALVDLERFTIQALSLIKPALAQENVAEMAFADGGVLLAPRAGIGLDRLRQFLHEPIRFHRRPCGLEEEFVDRRVSWRGHDGSPALARRRRARNHPVSPVTSRPAVAGSGVSVTE